MRGRLFLYHLPRVTSYPLAGEQATTTLITYRDKYGEKPRLSLSFEGVAATLCQRGHFKSDSDR